ncbi:bacterioferritin-associated ferredoxin [Marinomonas balearica]|uniref:Bacterioferritin-associated ferredoxin n=1 Tax=Marinomonas balearica TaxID=491947 RepID=A0A4V3CGZ8_9GAMM|nr:bacterioferritin-associated ferredoxin [Marinomonas balearica]TDO99682.1 bacterioferritin-associated ferredoxin [Marinomonas balearica]
MYVCLCKGVTDKQIQSAVQDGATTMRELYQETEAGSQCGKCCKYVKSILNEELLQLAESAVKVA